MPVEVTVTEAMKLSDFSRVHLYNLINRNRIKARKINTRAAPIILIDRESLEGYLKAKGRSVNGSTTDNR